MPTVLVIAGYLFGRGMTTLTLNAEPLAVDVAIDDVALTVVLEDGRTLSVPVAWFPRLRDAAADQRRNWRFIGRGEGIHWPEIDEDISVLGLLAGFGDTTTKRRPVSELSNKAPRHSRGGGNDAADVAG